MRAGPARAGCTATAVVGLRRHCTSGEQGDKEMFYRVLASETGDRPEARRLAEDLIRWHDEMVLHERQVKHADTQDICSPECPHGEAVRLWRDAKRIFGAAADRLAYLRRCARINHSRRVA